MSMLTDLYIGVRGGYKAMNGGVYMRDAYRDPPTIIVLNTYQC